MQIQKIFSDYYDDERIYSVLMSEGELDLYNELRMYAEDDEDEGLSTAAKIGIGAAGLAGLGASIYGGKKLLDRRAAKKIRKAAESKIVENLAARQSLGKEIAGRVKKSGKSVGQLMKSDKALKEQIKAARDGKLKDVTMIGATKKEMAKMSKADRDLFNRAGTLKGTAAGVTGRKGAMQEGAVKDAYKKLLRQGHSPKEAQKLLRSQMAEQGLRQYSDYLYGGYYF